jgi:hypothetical protein
MSDEQKTTAERLLFQLQLMGMMSMAGRPELADQAYVRTQELAQELIEQGH